MYCRTSPGAHGTCKRDHVKPNLGREEDQGGRSKAPAWKGVGFNGVDVDHPMTTTAYVPKVDGARLWLRLQLEI